MVRLMTRMTTVIVVLILALPIVGCQQKAKEREREKALDVQVDAGPVNVKVEGSKKPDEKGRHLDVEVQHPGQEHPSGDRNK